QHIAPRRDLDANDLCIDRRNAADQTKHQQACATAQTHARKNSIALWATCFRMSADLPACSSKSFCALGAGADAAQVIVAEDPGSVAVRKSNLDRVIANRGGSLRAHL